MAPVVRRRSAEDAVHAEAATDRVRAAFAAGRIALAAFTWRMGWWLWCYLAVSLLLAGLYLQGLRPLQQRVAGDGLALQRQSAQAPTETDAVKWAALRARLPAYAEYPGLVAALASATGGTWQWGRAEFASDIDAKAGLARVRINVRVADEYPVIVAAMLNLVQQRANLSLDRVQLRRALPGGTQAAGQVQISLWLRAPEDVGTPNIGPKLARLGASNEPR